MKKQGLTKKRSRFVDYYILYAAQNKPAWKAAKKAGFSGSKETLMSTASRLLTDVRVARAVQVRTSHNPSLVASYIERQEYLTSVMNSGEEETKDRLRALELLARSSGDYLKDVQRSNLQDILESASPETEAEASRIQEALTKLERPAKESWQETISVKDIGLEN